jgi:hypothetical protein
MSVLYSVRKELFLITTKFLGTLQYQILERNIAFWELNFADD